MHPARSPVTWALAFVLLVGIDAAITRTSLLWGPTAFENSGGIRLVFPQTYQVLRKIYHAERDAEVRVALLGNSRVVLGVKEAPLERAIHEIRPDLDVAVSNLGIFGSFIGDTQMLVRHLDPLDPSVVVLAVGAVDLMRAPTRPEGEGALSLLRVGWTDGPVGQATLGERLDRWARSVWRLYRFREFVREALLDRVLGREDPGAPPEEFPSREALFAHLYGERASAVAGAFRRWQREGGLDAYARYLETASAGHLARGKQRAKSRAPLTRETPSVVVLDALLRDLAEAGRPAFVLLMPENPILAEDVDGEFHRPGLADRAAGFVAELAAHHGIPVLDARARLPTEAFLDFDHPVWDLGDLERPLAQEIVDAVER